jgi:hypothetical protein
VVLFKCYWYDQDKKNKRTPKNDGYFISINTEAQWYKKETYILAHQNSKVMYLDDTINGKGWQYVQKFQPRNFYDVEENEKPNSKVAHQDDFTDPAPTGAAEIDEALEDTGNHANDGEVDFTAEKSIVEKEISKMKLLYESRDADDECEEDSTEMGDHSMAECDEEE